MVIRFFFKEWLDLNAKISWLASCSFIIWVLYFSAFLGWLHLTGIGLFIIGCFLAVIRVYRKIKGNNYLPLSFGILSLGLAFYFILFLSTLLQSHLEQLR